MSTPIPAVDATTARKLTKEIQELNDELASVQNTVEELGERISSNRRDADDRVRDLSNDLELAAETLDQLGDVIETAVKDIKRVDDRTAWIERHIRASGAARIADFDSPAKAAASLVATVRRGAQLGAELLAPAVRQQLSRHVQQAHDRLRKIEDKTHLALDANNILVSTPYDDPSHLNAAQTFRHAFGIRQDLVKEHRDKATVVEQAQRKLDEDDELRARHAKEIAAGTQAGLSLRTRMRTVVATAVGSGDLPPVWFSTALGVSAPRANTDTWLDLAADVLVYRAVYSIDDQVIALGPRPQDSAHDPGQHAEHRDLSARLRAF